MELQDTAAIVTGGASGLGEAVAHTLAKSGARVVIADVNVDAGEAVAKAVEGIFCKVDVADVDDVSVAVAQASELGELRALVNCAGIGLAMRTVARDGTPHDYAAFERIVRVNLLGTFNCIRLAAAAMGRLEPLADGERGAIVNTASVAAMDGQIGQVAYAASKGGIVGMTLPIARDLSSIGVRINTIAPGLIDTPIYGAGAEADAFKEHLAKSVPFPHRLGTAEEFASMTRELLTNGYMNGETIRVDGAIRMPPR
jgi:NAD(P)-dependent dehydrogenase (short-subunit alcohol dehydrogenase family)